MGFCTLDTQCVVYDRTAQLSGHVIGEGLCAGCCDNTQTILNLLRYDYVDLSQLIPKVDARSENKIFRPKPESSPPVNTAVFNLRGDIAWFVAVLATMLRRHLGSPPRPSPLPVREGFGLDANIRYLVERPEEIGRMPPAWAYWEQDKDDEQQQLDGLGVVLHLRRLHSRARRMCGTEEKVITVPGHCPPCNTPSLRREASTPEKIWCVHCKNTMDADQYKKVVSLQIHDMRNPAD